jgi:hypothetical protein
MPKQIIILETNPADGGQISLRTVLWFPVPAGQEVPIANFASAYKASATKPGPTAQETTDLQEGKVVEEVKTFSFPRSFTPAQLRASLQAAYADRLAYRATLPNVGAYYGVYFDGAAWV